MTRGRCADRLARPGNLRIVVDSPLGCHLWPDEQSTLIVGRRAHASPRSRAVGVVADAREFTLTAGPDSVLFTLAPR